MFVKNLETGPFWIIKIYHLKIQILTALGLKLFKLFQDIDAFVSDTRNRNRRDLRLAAAREKDSFSEKINFQAQNLIRVWKRSIKVKKISVKKISN